jgi:hypothetical protein
MSLKDYYADLMLQIEFHEWNSLALDVACDGKLTAEKQSRFCEITEKLVRIAGKQVPRIDPTPLIKLASLDPEALPSVASRWALFDAASLTRTLITAAWRGPRKPPKPTSNGADSSKPVGRGVRRLSVLSTIERLTSSGQWGWNCTQVARSAACTPRTVQMLVQDDPDIKAAWKTYQSEGDRTPKPKDRRRKLQMRNNDAK